MSDQPVAPRPQIDQSGQTILGNQTNVVNQTNIITESRIVGLSTDAKIIEKRKDLLKRLKKWIEEVINQSLGNAGAIPLDWNSSTDHIYLWQSLEQASEQVVGILHVEKKIIALLDNEYPSILIVGEPGIGKTTTLLELAGDLLERAEKDLNCPMPVVLNLSTWINEKQPIDEWVISELNDIKRKYEIPSKITEQWIENNQLILLLDGLDEIDRKFREECIDVINNFRQKYPSTPIVVTSRKHEISTLKKLVLKHEIHIQPLSEQKIYEYLARCEENTDAVKMLVETDVNYRELAQKPLMLSVMVMAYANESIDNLQSFESVNATKEHLFGKFMEKTFKTPEKHTSPLSNLTSEQKKQMKQWLSWLARQMNNQQDFYIDEMQPNYLPRRALFIYVVVSRLIVSLWIATIASFFVGGMSMILDFGLISGISVGIYNYIRLRRSKKIEIEIPRNANYSPGSLKRNKLQLFPWYSGVNDGILFPSTSLISRISDYFYTWLISALIMSMYFALTLYKSDDALWHIFEPRGIYLGAYVALFFAVVFGGNNHLYNRSADIVMVEKLSFSWRLILSAAVGALGIGLAVGLIAIVGYYWEGGNLDWFQQTVTQMGGGVLGAFTFGFTVGSFFGLITGAIIGSVEGNGDRLDQKGDVQPNYRIKKSIKNSGMVGLVGILCCTTFLGIRSAGQAENLREFITGLKYGVALGFLPTLHHGGVALIYHLVLRLILFYERKIPWNYAEFLENAAKYRCLQKISGGYRFFHQEFQKYLSAQNITEEEGQPRYRALLLILITSLALFAVIIKIAPSLSVRWHLLPGIYVNGLNFTSYEVQRGDTIRIESQGTIKVGNFIGIVGVDGITRGLTGSSIGDDYNVKQGVPHGALLCAIVATSEIDDIIKHPDEEMISKIPWEMCTSMPKYTHPLRRLVSYFAGDPHTREIYVERNGCLIFNINDNELENNSGAFRVKVDIDRNLSRSSNNNCSFVNILR